MGCSSHFAVHYWIPRRCALGWNQNTGIVPLNCKLKFIQNLESQRPSANTIVDGRWLCLTRIPGRNAHLLRGYWHGLLHALCWKVLLDTLLIYRACCGEKSLQMLLGCSTGVDKLNGEEAQCKFNVFRSPLEKSNLRACVTCPRPPLPCPWYQGQESGPHFQGQAGECFSQINSKELHLHSWTWAISMGNVL